MLKQITILYLSALILMLTMDGIWLSTMSKPFYVPRMGHLMAEKFSLLPAAIFYVLYVAILVTLILWPAMQSQQTLLKTMFQGALLGFAAYMAYDMTNQATLKNWSWTLSIVDMAWGATVTACVSGVSVWVTRWFER